MLKSDDPPIALTQNDACDRLLWYLYRQALSVNDVDAESVINDLQRRCGNVEVTMNSTPFITIEQLWRNVQEVDMAGELDVKDFIGGVQKLCLDDSISEADRVDFELLCRCHYCCSYLRSCIIIIIASLTLQSIATLLICCCAACADTSSAWAAPSMRRCRKCSGRTKESSGRSSRTCSASSNPWQTRSETALLLLLCATHDDISIANCCRMLNVFTDRKKAAPMN